MSDPLTPDDLDIDAIRKRNQRIIGEHRGSIGGNFCLSCRTSYYTMHGPGCDAIRAARDAVRLCDEVERLRAKVVN